MHSCGLCDYTGDAQQVATHYHNGHGRTYTHVEIEHGTTAGYQAHRRQGVPQCVPCKNAWREYFARKRSSRGG